MNSESTQEEKSGSLEIGDRVSYDAGYEPARWEGVIVSIESHNCYKVRWITMGNRKSHLTEESYSMPGEVLKKSVETPPSSEPKKAPLKQPYPQKKDPFEGYVVVGEGTNERERNPFPVDDGKKKPYGAFGVFLENQV